MDKSFDMFWETEVPQDEVIISRTNLQGKITHANDVFCDISGYTESELIGHSHNIIRHPDMPASVFKELWETIKSGRIWRGHVKNRRKDGGYYWVYSEISPVIKEGKIIEYKSMRSRMPEGLRREMQTRYDEMREEEGGLVRVIQYLSHEQYASSQNKK